MHKNVVLLIWIAGAALTAALYAAGPDRAAHAALLALESLPNLIASAIQQVAFEFRTVMRAATLALFAVFLALCVTALQRGLRVRWALLLVSAMFVALLHGPVMEGMPASGERWLGAFALAAVGAAVMTKRLAAGR